VAGGHSRHQGDARRAGCNRIEQVYGILNGTCNYILTQMRETGREFPMC